MSARRLILAVAVTACGDHHTAPTPVILDPPPGLELGGGPLFELDTAKNELELPVAGDPASKLVGLLASPEGKRRLVLQRNTRELIADSDWNLPPASAATTTQLFVCWNRLTGPASPSGGMPHPSQGLALLCRLRGASGAWSSELPVATDGVPRWVSDVSTSASGGFDLTYLRDADGWLVRPMQPGDGYYHRHFDDGFGPEVFVRAAMPQ